MSRILVLLCASWFGFAVAEWSARPPLYALDDAEHHFEQFIKKYERNYANEHEKEARFKIFKERLEEINHLNENSKHAVYGITKFTDLSREELSEYTCLRHMTVSDDYKSSCKVLSDADIGDYNAPESFDWRDHQAVTSVRDQQSCGGCFAFSAVGNIEGQYAIKHKQLIELSEQQILDCDKKNYACGGGFMDVAFRSLVDGGGIESEADYPYKAKNDTCHFDASKVKVKLADCHAFNLTSQEKVKQLLYHTGPIAIGIKGRGLFQYNKGIISDESCDVGNLSHAVLLVGYGIENGTPIWIVKNSWGLSYGEDGYFKMHRGEKALSCSMMNIFMSSSIIA